MEKKIQKKENENVRKKDKNIFKEVTFFFNLHHKYKQT